MRQAWFYPSRLPSLTPISTLSPASRFCPPLSANVPPERCLHYSYNLLASA